MTFIWHSEFIRWIESELQEKVPSSQNLTNLLSEYAESNKNNLEIKGNLQDWIEDNRDDVLNSIKNSKMLKIVYDKDAEYNSIELVSIGLLNERPPNRQRVQARDDVESFPQILLLQRDYDQLRDEIRTIKTSVDEIRNNIGTKNNSEYTLYEFLRNHDKKLNDFKEKNSILENKFGEFSESIGRRGNLPQDIFEWIRSKDEDISQIGELSKKLGLHIGNGDFKSEADTFKTHSTHILPILLNTGLKEKSVFAIVLGIILFTIYAVVDYQTHKTNFTNLKEKTEEIENQLKQFATEMDTIKNNSNRQGKP